MRVTLQGLSPGMQNTEEADLSAEAGGIGGNFQKCSRAGFEQQAEEELLVLPDQRHQRMGHAEHQVEIAHWQQFPSARTQPLLSCVGLALRTVAVSAGVVRDDLMSAANALIAMAAERGCAAALDGPEHFELCPRQRTAIAFDESASCR